MNHVTEPQEETPACDVDKQPYDPPQATVVEVELQERVLGCNFSTIEVCGLTE